MSQIKTRVREWVQSMSRSLGYELIPVWRMRQHELVTHLRRLFDLHQIDTVLDVGANTGQYHDFLRMLVGFKGTIISFEPVSKNISMLRQRAAEDAQWKICDYALGKEDTTMVINVMARDSFSSFLNPAENAPGMFKDLNTIDYQETVSIRRLDTILAQVLPKGVGKNIYLKLDTQGYDLNVVEGANGVLDRIRALQSEVAVLRIYDNMPDYFTSIQTLNQKGFEMTGLFPVSRDENQRVVEFDCVMINSKNKIGL